MSLLFISDLHLDEDRPDITAGFKNFLVKYAPEAEKLYILGDFFEVWLGDDHETLFNSEIIQLLSDLSMPKFIMHGNRDFLLGEAFCQQTGCELLADPTVIEFAGKSILLMHGDSLCTQDTEYMAVRQMLRNPDVQKDLLSKSLQERAAIARGARDQSKEHTRETAADIMDVTMSEVERVMQENEVRLMIHGHTHRPAIHELQVSGEPAKRIVLGDWGEFGWCLSLDGEEQALIKFELN
jgi:UDP-2,3-diacylglucosamine hydrolase